MLQNQKIAPTILNASNEVAVEAFLAGRIGFLDIPAVVESTLSALPMVALDCLEDVFRADREARATAGDLLA